MSYLFTVTSIVVWQNRNGEVTLKPEGNPAWGSCCLLPLNQKARDKDWIIIELLFSPEASNLRRWRVKTLTSTLPWAFRIKFVRGNMGIWERKFLGGAKTRCFSWEGELKGESSNFFPSWLLCCGVISVICPFACLHEQSPLPQTLVVYGLGGYVFFG